MVDVFELLAWSDVVVGAACDVDAAESAELLCVAGGGVEGEVEVEVESLDAAGLVVVGVESLDVVVGALVVVDESVVVDASVVAGTAGVLDEPVVAAESVVADESVMAGELVVEDESVVVGALTIAVCSTASLWRARGCAVAARAMFGCDVPVVTLTVGVTGAAGVESVGSVTFAGGGVVSGGEGGALLRTVGAEPTAPARPRIVPELGDESPVRWRGGASE